MFQNLILKNKFFKYQNVKHRKFTIKIHTNYNFNILILKITILNF